jgi:hypothetical protein
MIRGYIECAENNLSGCFARMQNQYGIISKGTDWNKYHNSHDAKEKYNSIHPRSIGDLWTTRIEQCEETGKWLMNILLTDEQVARLKEVPTTPVFSFQYEGELDSDGEPLPTPTFKVKIMDESEPPVWTGNYRDQTVCKQ